VLGLDKLLGNETGFIIGENELFVLLTRSALKGQFCLQLEHHLLLLLQNQFLDFE